MVVLAIAAPGADVSSIGSWTESIDSGDLVAGAGSNLVSQYESVSGTTTLDVSNTAGGAWRVLARRSSGTWHGSFRLSIRRSSDGSGSGSVQGGTTYMELGTLDTEIFTGGGERNGIALQLKLTGMSTSVPPDTYSSGIIFTVVPQ